MWFHQQILTLFCSLAIISALVALSFLMGSITLPMALWNWESVAISGKETEIDSG